MSLITLTTDFGEAAPYGAVMKGVILSIHPDARLLDLTHRIRPQDANKDPFGVAKWQAQLATSYDVLEKRLAGRSWAAGDTFTLADCGAFPSLYYGNRAVPIGDDRPILTSYLNRLQTRPSIARVFKEAEPYLHMFPI
mgnify:CR=1 FL=1